MQLYFLLNCSKYLLLYVLYIEASAVPGEARPSWHNNRSLSGDTRNLHKRVIIGGTDALLGAWPWQLSHEMFISGGWTHVCGASLISSTRALSAAHCLIGRFETQRIFHGVMGVERNKFAHDRYWFYMKITSMLACLAAC